VSWPLECWLLYNAYTTVFGEWNVTEWKIALYIQAQHEKTREELLLEGFNFYSFFPTIESLQVVLSIIITILLNILILFKHRCDSWDQVYYKSTTVKVIFPTIESLLVVLLLSDPTLIHGQWKPYRDFSLTLRDQNSTRDDKP